MDAAAALYRSREKEKAGLLAMGFSEADASALVAQAAPVEIWPENWQAIMVFEALSTQWNVGMAGIVGLRYEVLPAVLRACGVAASDRPRMFQQIRIMERAALGVMRG